MSLSKIQDGSLLVGREIADVITNTSVTVGSSTTEIAAANLKRIELVLVNDSSETIYLGIGASAVMNKGVRLNANGGSYVERNSTAAINGICSSGSKNICVVEKSHAA